MAYMNQERKATIAANVKPILAKYGMKGTLRVKHNLVIVLTLRSGPIDFIGDMQREKPFDKDMMRERYALVINPYHYPTNYLGDSYFFLKEIFEAMKSAAWYDRSDSMTDYFDTAYYIEVKVGDWTKPYQYTPRVAALAT
jgi:uncharacterized protein YutD